MLRKKLLVTIVFATLISVLTLAQKTEHTITLPQRYRVMGINTTPLLVQLIPFNRSNPSVTGPYYVNYRSYGPRGGAFKFALGAFIDPTNDIDFEASFLNLQLGFDKRKAIFGRWAYTRGFSFFLVAGDLNLEGTKPDDGAKIGVGPVWSVEYSLSEFVALSIETALLIGINPDFPEFVMEFIPPVSLFLNLRIPKRDRRR